MGGMHAKHADETESCSLNFGRGRTSRVKLLFSLCNILLAGRGTGGPQGQPVSRCPAQGVASLGSQPFRDDCHSLDRRIGCRSLYGLCGRRGRNGRMRVHRQGRKGKHSNRCDDNRPIEKPCTAGFCFCLCLRKHVPHSCFALPAFAAVNHVHSAFRCFVGHACQIECFGSGTIVFMLHCSECWPCTRRMQTSLEIRRGDTTGDLIIPSGGGWLQPVISRSRFHTRIIAGVDDHARREIIAL